MTAGRPVVVRHAVRHRDWPAGPLTIAVISDLHAGWPWVSAAAAGRIVDRVNTLAPDLAIFAGDGIADRNTPCRPVRPERIAAELARLSAPLGRWAILGNHDWSDDEMARGSDFTACAIDAALGATGVPVLRNTAVALGATGAWLVGLDSRQALKKLGRPGFDDLRLGLRDVPQDAPVILLAHEPDIFAEQARAFLQISGHTHGGQIAPFGQALHVPSEFGTRYAWGLYEREGRWLVVSGGIGFSGPPLRVGRPPEITLIELSSA